MSLRKGAGTGEPHGDGPIPPEGVTRPIPAVVPWWTHRGANRDGHLGDRHGTFPPVRRHAHRDGAHRDEAARNEAARNDEARNDQRDHVAERDDVDKPNHVDQQDQRVGEQGYDGPGHGERTAGTGIDESFDLLWDATDPPLAQPEPGHRAQTAPGRRGSIIVLAGLAGLVAVSVAVVVLGAGGSRSGRAGVADQTTSTSTPAPTTPGGLDPGAGGAAGVAARATTAPTRVTTRPSPARRPRSSAPPPPPPAAPSVAARPHPPATRTDPSPTQDGNVDVQVTVDVG